MISLLKILTENKFFVPERSRQERRERRKLQDFRRIQDYIKNGSQGNLDLTDCVLTELPNNLVEIGGELILGSETELNKLPTSLKVIKGNLWLSSSKISSLPDNLHIMKNLYANNSNLSSLPETLKVNETVNVASTKISKLPDDLNVGRNLNLVNTAIDSIPKNLNVKGDLYIGSTKLVRDITYQLSQQPDKPNISDLIRDMIEQKGGSVGGNIYT